MSNPTLLVDNHDEYSRTVLRPDGTRLDICAMRLSREFVVALVNDENVPVEEIVLTAHERAVLAQHMSDPITQTILGENEKVKCPSCGEIVRDFNHPYCSGGKNA